MPPITNDLRFDAQFGIATDATPPTVHLVANGGTYNNGNVGDDSPGVVRLRRVWDTLVDRIHPGAGSWPQHQQRAVAGAQDGLSADLSVVSAALSGALAGNSDPDPCRRSDKSAYQVFDHPAGFYGQALSLSVSGQ